MGGASRPRATTAAPASGTRGPEGGWRSCAQTSGPLYTVAFDRSGGRLFSAGDDGKVRLWDVRSGRLLRTVAPEAGALLPAWLAFSGDGERMVTPGRRSGA